MNEKEIEPDLLKTHKTEKYVQWLPTDNFVVGKNYFFGTNSKRAPFRLSTVCKKQKAFYDCWVNAFVASKQKIVILHENPRINFNFTQYWSF